MMDDNVLHLVASSSGSVEVDLALFDQWLQDAEPYSTDKMHVQRLVAMIAEDEKQPMAVRKEAVRLLIRTSDIMASIATVPDLLELCASGINQRLQRDLGN